MKHFCTVLDHTQLAQGRTLCASLVRHAAGHELTLLCVDDATFVALQAQAQSGLRLLRIGELLTAHPPLAAAQQDRTAAEFGLTCRPWLLGHLLQRLPPKELLTFVAPTLCFFSSLAPVFAELGQASVGVIPQCGPNEGFTSHWISLRHDATGLACVDAWAKSAIDHGPERNPAKPFGRWFIQHPGTTVVSNPCALVAPCNLGRRRIDAGPVIDDQPIIAYDFSDLVALTRQLYDPGLARYDIAVSPALRIHLYQPYLRALAQSTSSTDQPDIIPPAALDDPRCGAVLPLLADRTRQAERSQAAAKAALGQTRAAALAFATEAQARTAESERYLHQVEQDRDKQRQAFFDTRQRLEEIHQDLLHNIAYLKKLEAEANAARQASLDRETYVASLQQQLAAQQTGGSSGPDLTQLHQALLLHGRELRRVLVIRYHPALLPTILSLAAQGVTVDVLGSPTEFVGQSHGSIHFLGGELWSWLGGLNSFFDETRYLHLNPDIAAAITSGTMRSGWDHYQRFGQREGRATGAADFRTGLADFDAIAFDSAVAGQIVPCLVGRMQPHHRLFVSSSFNPATVWLPADTHRTIVLGDLLCCPRPPSGWLGPLIPSALPVSHRPPPGLKEVYPETPVQPALWPKITVVTSSHNQAAHLETTLRSVLDQHYPALEYLVVDAASTDGTVEIIQRHANRLAWWASEPCASTGEALGKGFAKASGSIVTWLNPGDQLAPGSLFTVALQFLLHIPDIVAGRCLKEIADGPASLHRSVLSLGQQQPLPLPELLDLDGFWRSGAFFLQPGTFITRAAWDRVGGLNQKLVHAFDYDLWLRLARSGARVLPLPEVLARQSPVTAAASSAVLAELRTIRAAQPIGTPSA